MTLNKTKNQTPDPVDQQPSVFGQMMSTMFQGWAFGTGSAAAHKAVDSLSNSIKVNNKEEVNNNVEIKEHQCKDILTEYNICAQNIKPDENINKCKDVIELYRACVS